MGAVHPAVAEKVSPHLGRVETEQAPKVQVRQTRPQEGVHMAGCATEEGGRFLAGPKRFRGRDRSHGVSLVVDSRRKRTSSQTG